MDAKEILLFELNHFRNGIGSTIDFSSINALSVKKALSKALNDTLAMAVKRFGTTYKGIEDELLNTFVNDFIGFASTEITEINNDSFNEFFNTLTSKFISKMDNLDRSMFATYGFAQKFISMSFKYMYCFDDALRTNFICCKLPLDKYTINWYRKYGDGDILNRFKKIDFSWSNLDKELYSHIQNNIDNILINGCNYPIKCTDFSQTISLPTNKIEVEFIVWSQERLNETYNEILKYSEYFNRLGIKIE
jgi:hypothetical protein